MNFSRQVALFKQSMLTDGNSGFHFLLKLLMMILSFLMLFLADFANSGAKGLYMLQLVSSTNLFFVTVATVSLFCTSVTEEKEHNTLGALLMTGISPFGFLTGKIISRLYIVLQLILLQIPLIVIARTLGGLAMEQILAHLVYFLSVVFVMSQVGMFFSVISQRSSHAIFFSVISLSFLCVLPCNDSASFISYYFEVFDTGFKESVVSQPVMILFGISAFAFMSALMLFNRFSYDEGSNKLNSEISLKKAAQRERYKTNPIFEKDFRYYTGYRLGLFLRVVFGFILVSLPSIYQMSEVMFGVTVAWFYCECFYYSQVMIKSEKTGKTLSSLGMLPLTAKSILNQKYKAFAVSVAPSLLTFLYLCFSTGREVLPSLVTFALFTLSVFSHFLISLVCSLRYEKMSLLISILYILLYSLTFFMCPMGWLLFLPSLVILSVNVYEKFALEISSG